MGCYQLICQHSKAVCFYLINQTLSQGIDRLAIFAKKLFKDNVKLIRYFHHRCMPAFVDEVQFTIWDEPFKFLCYKRRSNSIIIAPDQAGRLFNPCQFVAQVISDSTLREGNNFNNLNPVVSYFEYLIYKFISSHSRIVKSKLGLFTDVLSVATFGISVTHSTFKQP